MGGGEGEFEKGFVDGETFFEGCDCGEVIWCAERVVAQVEVLEGVVEFLLKS